MQSSTVATLFAAALAVLVFKPAAAVRIGFISDTGIGNDNPGDYWVDFYGNSRAPEYLVNGKPCLDYKGEACQLYSRARDVIKAMRDNGVELIVHAGDLDYESNPRMWNHFLDETTGGMDYLAVKGNHDEDGWDGMRWLWSGSDGYQALLKNRIPPGAKCEGEYGEDMACVYKGVFLLLSSVGVEKAGESANKAHYEYMDRKLAESKEQFKICVWHMTQADMQVSYKGDSVGWGAYEICRKHGALIVTGHAHTYSRTHEMARFGNKVYGHTNKDLVVNHRGDNRIHLSKGENGTTGVVVVGISGYKNEDQLRSGDYWAKVYSSKCMPDDPVCETAPPAKKFGAVVCDFSNWGARAENECWLVTTLGKNASNQMKRQSYKNPVDRFFVVSGPRTGREVYVNSEEGEDATNTRRKLQRRECFDVLPPSDGGPQYSCEQQRDWGKCNNWFMTEGNYCAKTCGRCSDLFEGAEEDYTEQEDEDEEETMMGAPAPAPEDDDTDDVVDGDDEEVPAAPALTPAGDEDDMDDADEDAPPPSPAPAPEDPAAVPEMEAPDDSDDEAPAPTPSLDDENEDEDEEDKADDASNSEEEYER